MTSRSSSTGLYQMFNCVTRLTLVGAFSVLLAACVTGPKADRIGSDNGTRASGSQATLEQRAVERWRLLIDRKPIDAYEYLTPGFRSTMSRDTYVARQARGAIKWTNVSWDRADCDPADVCKARLRVEYSVKLPGAGDTTSFNLQTEDWLKIDGVWYFLPAKS